MHISPLLGRQDSSVCLKGCPPPTPCACSANESCVQINRDCYTCGATKCVVNVSSSGASTSASVSKGALAGAVVGAILFLVLAVCLYLWFRRTSRLRKAPSVHDVKDIPAPAETVLNRPNPTEKPTPAPSVIDDTSLQPPYVFLRDGNPFDDNNSIQTAGTGGTNVIPIALISPEHSIRSETDTIPSINSGPIRPARSPELNLNLDHVNVSRDNLRPGNNYEPSTHSGVSAVSSVRHSYMSGMTYASDFLTEAPMIMTPTKGPIRQVMGVAKPEVINAGSISSQPSFDSLRPPPTYSRPTAKSPLAATSFGPSDVLRESDEKDAANPFDDKHSSTNAEYSLSPPPTATTIQTTRQDRESTGSGWIPENPSLPWAKQDDSSRPSSMSTQAGSVVDIASATRVNVGLMTPGTATSGARTPYRTTMGRLISPSATGSSAGSLREQQARALAHAQAQAQAQGLGKPRPISGSSVISATADSILESFPFVPPSPISNRPIRSPPVSPLGQSTFGVSNASSPLAQHTFVVAPPSPQPSPSFSQDFHSTVGALPPPSRQTLGMSTASQLSTASTGLGSFPFQIDSGSDRPESGLQARSSLFNRQRASLDTLALTSDLSSYPLGFDRDSVPMPKGNRI